MLIGEIVSKTGFSKDTIRFYEKKKLITIGRKERRDNNYKEYSAEILERLLTIKRLKGFGFTLNEVSDILEMIAYNVASCENMKDRVADKVNLLDVKIRELIEVRTMLLNVPSNCNTACSPEKSDENCAVLMSDEFLSKA